VDAGPPTADATERSHSRSDVRGFRPSRPTLVLAAVWVVGLLIAVAVPAAIAPPNESSPGAGRLWLAFAFSALGAGVMLTVAALVYRRTKDAAALVLGAVPAVSVILGGLILVATKGFQSQGYGGS
jgi:hypothetical protein